MGELDSTLSSTVRQPVLLPEFCHRGSASPRGLPSPNAAPRTARTVPVTPQATPESGRHGEGPPVRRLGALEPRRLTGGPSPCRPLSGVAWGVTGTVRAVRGAAFGDGRPRGLADPR